MYGPVRVLMYDEKAPKDAVIDEIYRHAISINQPVHYKIEVHVARNTPLWLASVACPRFEPYGNSMIGIAVEPRFW